MTGKAAVDQPAKAASPKATEFGKADAKTSVQQPAKAPRLRSGEPFDPAKRRPSLRQFPNVKAGPVDRHDGVRTIPSARVSVFKHKLPNRLRGEHDHLMKVLGDPKTSTEARQAAGRRYERMVAEDLAAQVPSGQALRTRSISGDRLRIGDVGSYEVTAAKRLTPEKFDQIWRDLVATDRVTLTVPRLSDSDASKLAKMGAIYEHVSGRRPRILVRETAR